ITKTTLAKYFNTRLVIHEEALAEVTAFFRSRGRELTELNRLQAALPENCTFVSNTMGTAPGMWFEQKGKVFVSMPGVPYEMKGLMTNRILAMLQQHFRTPIIHHKIIRTVGIGESVLAEKIEYWEDNLPAHIKLAYLPNLSQVKLRLTATGENRSRLEEQVQQEIDRVMPLIAPYVYGYDDEDLEKAVGQLLLRHQLTLAAAESCSGGYLAHLVTRVPGSSRYFRGAVVPYSNDLKTQLLGVKEDTLTRFGAVSEQTAREMAERVREKLGTSLGVSSTGVAGPSGGTEEKPVGTVWIACADGHRTEARKLQLSQFRELNIQLTAVHVLNLLRTFVND
ncbi:MAG: nicotinamide-nucleotide amidohydrolase family protein, partial [Ferruginibacter sp.]|nr:nicotinamide-nucleotide amidohydrolase family protein [Cytophagales bacterium]